MTEARMKKSRRIEITTISRRTLVIEGVHKAARLWCGRCGGEVPMLTVDAAAVLAGTDIRSIYRVIENRTLHFVETPEILVCLKSLDTISTGRIRELTKRGATK